MKNAWLSLRKQVFCKYWFMSYQKKYNLGHAKFLYIEVFNESHQNVNNYCFVHTAIFVNGQYNSHGIYRIHRS